MALNIVFKCDDIENADLIVNAYSKKKYKEKELVKHDDKQSVYNIYYQPEGDAFFIKQLEGLNVDFKKAVIYMPDKKGVINYFFVRFLFWYFQLVTLKRPKSITFVLSNACYDIFRNSDNNPATYLINQFLKKLYTEEKAISKPIRKENTIINPISESSRRDKFIISEDRQEKNKFRFSIDKKEDSNIKDACSSSEEAYIEDFSKVSCSYAPKVNQEVLDRLNKQARETFQDRLFKLIDEKGLTDVECYKRANIDRRLFSKIKCNNNYSPSKETVISFAIALKLNLEETKDFLRVSGFALSESVFDIVVSYYIENKIYDILEINQTLNVLDQKLLGF